CLAALSASKLSQPPRTITIPAGSGILLGSALAFSTSATAGTAATMAANSPSSQTAPAGTAVSSPPSVIVKDANGNPVAGVAVTRSEERRGGKVSGARTAQLEIGLGNGRRLRMRPRRGRNRTPT